MNETKQLASISELAKWTGRSRESIRNLVQSLQPIEGPKQSKLYALQDVIRLLAHDSAIETDAVKHWRAKILQQTHEANEIEAAREANNLIAREAVLTGTIDTLRTLFRSSRFSLPRDVPDVALKMANGPLTPEVIRAATLQAVSNWWDKVREGKVLGADTALKLTDKQQARMMEFIFQEDGDTNE